MFNPFLFVSLFAVEPQTLSKIIDEHAKTASIDPSLMVAIAYHESHFDPKAVSDVKKDFGIYQIRFGAATRGFKFKKKDLLDPEINTVLAILYMRDQLERCKTIAKALGAYSSGRCQVNSYSKTILRTYRALKNPKNNVTKRIVYGKLWSQDQKMLDTAHVASKNNVADPFSLNTAQVRGSL